MTGKTKVVKVLREKLGWTVKDSEAAFDATVAAIKEAADAGEAVRLPGIGVIRKNDIEAHEAVNPKTQEKVNVPARFNYKLKSQTRTAE